MVRHNNWVTGVFIGSVWAFAAAVSANDPCLASATTDYERVYCHVVSEGEGAGLPSLVDFKRNAASVQALLLKRPASRLGITLPVPPSTPEASPEAPLNVAHEAAPSADTASAGLPALNDCQLQGKVIACPSQRFHLTANQPNSALKPGVLDDDNMLALLPFEGDRGDEALVRGYLSQAYDQYIAKMVAIGLGGTTMTFSEFYYGFHRMEAEGVDFARRLERTYQLLKQDKKTMAVKAHYHDDLPDSIEMCMEVGPDIIVCDDVATNWVYVSQP